MPGPPMRGRASFASSTALLEHLYNVAATDRIRSDIQLRLHDQARVIDLAAFDTKEFYDDFARALDVLDERVIKCFKDLASVAGNVVSIATLAFNGVTFSYVPGVPVLRDVAFEVERGQMLAIVGHNGAGKSTIAKLLLRLYDPGSGTVLLNGLPYGRFAKADLRRQVAVVFQDHCHYAYSIAENVLMRPPEPGDEECG